MFMSWEPMDIEEIHKQAQKGQYCPYYTTKDRVMGADLIFMPYNYLIDEKIRENFGINYNNAVIIFDEAHNIAPCSEEVTSFEVKSGYLEKCLIEIHALQEARSQNEEREWKADERQLGLIKVVTEKFKKFLCEFSLDPNDNPTCIQNVSSNRYLPNQSIVLQGSEIFNLFLEGSKFKDTDERNNVVEKNLASEWYRMEQYFTNVLNDITETTNDRVKSQLENWYEVLKKVMRMWTSDSAVAQEAIARGSKHQVQQPKSKKGPLSANSLQSGQSSAEAGQNDANDFYVFLYDEEDKSNT